MPRAPLRAGAAHHATGNHRCTLGKLEILKLRADVQKQQGFAPIAIARKAMLGDDSPVLQGHA